jgi:hypothetical protein
LVQLAWIGVLVRGSYFEHRSAASLGKICLFCFFSDEKLAVDLAAHIDAAVLLG